MTPIAFTLSPDAYNAHLVCEVIDATAPQGETASAKETRFAMIVETFRAFEPANAMEAMIACHCIALQFVLTAAMRDAGNVNLEPVVLARMRASAMSISKTLHLWLSKFERIHARNETRVAEAHAVETETVVPIPALTPTPAPTLKKQPPAAPPREAPIPDVPRVACFGQADPVMPAMREALLSSAAVLSGASANGRLIIPAASRGA
jgi:hypothetical protein